MKIFRRLVLTVAVAIVVERCRAEFLLVEVDDAAGKGSMSTNTAKARKIEELARQGICDIKPCCCDDCYPCDYERIAEAKELAKAKKVEGPKQIPNLKHGPKMSVRSILRSARMMNDTNQMLATNGCYWDGTAPFCQGRCAQGWTEVERNKQGDGVQCWKGSKARCCKHGSLSDSCTVKGNPGDGERRGSCGEGLICFPDGSCKEQACKWFGFSPFCHGVCPSGWEYQRKSKRGDGIECWTGEKYYCCKTQLE